MTTIKSSWPSQMPMQNRFGRSTVRPPRDYIGYNGIYAELRNRPAIENLSLAEDKDVAVDDQALL